MDVDSVAEQILFTTCRIETTLTNERRGVATGFIFNYICEDKNYLFIVTNKHVVNDSLEGSITFLLNQDGKPLLGRGHKAIIPDFRNIWYGHPKADIDVAIAPFVPIVEELSKAGVDIFYKSINNNLIPSADALKTIDAIEEVVFVGYPNGIWDSMNLLPIMRRGTTATPIVVDFCGKPQFLIDASVFGGSSGSPVFIYNSGMYSVKGKGTIVGDRLLFLGIVTSVFFRENENEIRERYIPTVIESVSISKEMLDLGVVFKARTITEAIESFLQMKGVIKR